MKFRSWQTSRPAVLPQQYTHELRGRSRLADGSTTKALIAGHRGLEGRSPIGWGVQGQGLRIDNLSMFFGAEGPRSVDFESIDEPLTTPLGARVYLGSNGTLYAVVVESQIVVLTPNRVIAGDVRMQLALDGSLSQKGDS